jgi:26S proteasome regulatory subunit N13
VATDAAIAVQNFLNSLKGDSALGSSSRQVEGQLYTTLSDLLPTSATIPITDRASSEQVDNLLSYLPPTIFLISQESTSQVDSMAEPTTATAAAALKALSIERKKVILKRVLRSPQFHQSLSSLTFALRDGGLPSIADALGIRVVNGGLVQGGSMPLGGGDAVEAFVEGVKKTVQEN